MNADIPTPQRCRIALLGFGTVGSALARRLVGPGSPGSLDLSHIFDRRAGAKRTRLGHERGGRGFVADVAWTERIDDILASDADVVVEAIGGTEPATEWIRAALLAGKSVVTANKQVVARSGPSLMALAARQGRQLRFEAAVGGAMPIVHAVADGLAGDRLTRIVAILNGTTNAVLSRMEAGGCTMARAVAEARARGYAEVDPTADLDGSDAAAKLSILCALAFRLRIDPSQIARQTVAGIEPHDFRAARHRGQTIRQLASAAYDDERSMLTAWVAPVFVPRTSIFGRTAGPGNAAIVSGEFSGDIGIFGAGAGGDATAVALISDLLAIARDPAAIVPPPILSTPSVVSGLTGSDIVPGAHGSGPADAAVAAGFDFESQTRYAEAV